MYVGGACIAHAQCSVACMTVERGTQTEKCAWSFEIACGVMGLGLCVQVRVRTRARKWLFFCFKK